MPEQIQSDTQRRAVRSVPGSGHVWARYLRFLVSRLAFHFLT